MTLLRELGAGLLHLLYPPVCPVCGELANGGEGPFCEACRTGLLADPFPRCPRCAGTVGPFAAVEHGCPHCRGERFHFDRVVRLGPYAGLLREAILRLKHRSGEDLADHLGRLWAREHQADLRALGAEVILPVPLHWRRRWARGYNQSEILA